MVDKRTQVRRKRLTGSVEEALGKLTGIDDLQAAGADKKRAARAEEAATRAVKSTGANGKRR